MHMRTHTCIHTHAPRHACMHVRTTPQGRPAPRDPLCWLHLSLRCGHVCDGVLCPVLSGRRGRVVTCPVLCTASGSEGRGGVSAWLVACLLACPGPASDRDGGHGLLWACAERRAGKLFQVACRGRGARLSGPRSRICDRQTVWPGLWDRTWGLCVRAAGEVGSSV